MKILVVDDSLTIRQAISKTVTKLGFEPVEAANGAEAMSKIRGIHAETKLIILDVNMPVMDGFSVLTKVKASEDYRQIPVLMATADGVKEDVIKALKAGATSYLIKPFDNNELQTRICEILNLKPQETDSK
mgnify:CR=1 FL=1